MSSCALERRAQLGEECREGALSSFSTDALAWPDASVSAAGCAGATRGLRHKPRSSAYAPMRSRGKPSRVTTASATVMYPGEIWHQGIQIIGHLQVTTSRATISMNKARKSLLTFTQLPAGSWAGAGA